MNQTQRASIICECRDPERLTAHFDTRDRLAIADDLERLTLIESSLQSLNMLLVNNKDFSGWRDEDDWVAFPVNCAFCCKPHGKPNPEGRKVYCENCLSKGHHLL